jgi:hypothetical protein
MSEAFNALASYLRGYLHQDWDLDASSPVDLVQQFAREEPVPLVSQLVAELDQMLLARHSEADLRAVLIGLGSYYDPGATGASTSGWLIELRDAAAAGLARRR